MSSDGRPGVPTRHEVMGNCTSNDGNVLLFNVHLSDRGRQCQSNTRTARTACLTSLHSELLFRMSSVLPDSIRGHGGNPGPGRSNDNSRGFVFNADMTALVQFLDIGTRGPSNLH